MIRRIDNNFRVQPNIQGYNASDAGYTVQPTTAGFAQRTQGFSQLDRVPLLFPATAEHCEILAFTVSASLKLTIQNGDLNPLPPIYGKFGRILAGLTSTGTQSYAAPLAPIPSDLTLLGTLFDPATDDLPPLVDALSLKGSVYLPIGLTQNLSERLPIPRGGIDLLMGIWMLPSIVSSTDPNKQPGCYLTVADAAYSIFYDDGT